MGNRQGREWIDLWTMAASADFRLGTATSEVERFTLLASDDQLEMSLRHLSAHIYEARTRDRAGAAHMRAVVAPGSSVDVAPGWLVPDATLFSKAEHQRSERVSAEFRRRGGKDTGKGKDKDKGKKGAGQDGAAKRD